MSCPDCILLPLGVRLRGKEVYTYYFILWLPLVQTEQEELLGRGRSCYISFDRNAIFTIHVLWIHIDTICGDRAEFTESLK